MSLDSEIRGVLLANSAVAALVSTKIWGGKGPDNPVDADYPHIVLRLVDDTSWMESTAGSLLMRRARLQVEPFSPVRATAKAISEAVLDALQGYRSATASPAGTLIKSCLFELQVELYDDQLGTWSVPTDFMIVHEG